MELDVSASEEGDDGGSEADGGPDERAVPEQRSSDREPPRKSVYLAVYLCCEGFLMRVSCMFMSTCEVSQMFMCIRESSECSWEF